VPELVPVPVPDPLPVPERQVVSFLLFDFVPEVPVPDSLPELYISLEVPVPDCFFASFFEVLLPVLYELELLFLPLVVVVSCT
jgi:hypothetical protein